MFQGPNLLFQGCLTPLGGVQAFPYGGQLGPGLILLAIKGVEGLGQRLELSVDRFFPCLKGANGFLGLLDFPLCGRHAILVFAELFSKIPRPIRRQTDRRSSKHETPPQNYDFVNCLSDR